MVNPQPMLAELVQVFPQLASSRAWGNSRERDRQWQEFAHLIKGLYQEKNYGAVQAAFDRLEALLVYGNHELRSWVAGFLQSLQDLDGWSSATSDVFLRFFGPDVRRVWETLNQIRFDLADCPILEAEVLMWRVVHHATRFSPTTPRP